MRFLKFNNSIINSRYLKSVFLDGNKITFDLDGMQLSSTHDSPNDAKEELDWIFKKLEAEEKL